MTCSPFRQTSRPILALACVFLASGCHLVDQRSFDPQAGVAPLRQAAAPAAVSSPALVTIVFTNPPPSYGAALAGAVRQALAAKPDVAFVVEASAPPALHDAALAHGAEVAAALQAAGASRARTEQSLIDAPALRQVEVRLRVR